MTALRSVAGALPRLTPAQARAANLLHTGARSLTLQWLGQPLRLVRQRPTPAGPWQLQLHLGGYGATLGLDGLQALLPGLDPLAADSDPALHAALFAQLAAGLWAALGLDGPEPGVQLAAPSPSSQPPAPATELAIGLQLHNQRCGTRSQACLVFDSPAAASAFGAAWARLAGPSPAPPADLPLALRFEVGSRRLAPAELRGLRPGDLVLLARLPSRGGRWQARVLAGAGRSCIGLGHVKGDGIVMEQWQVPKAPGMAAAATAPAANGLLDGVSVEIAFEIGHHRMALGELMQLAPGHVFALGANPEGDAVDLVVDGRVIGAGQLVLVGEALGVRVLRLQLEAQAPVTAPAREPVPAAAATA
jgi:type III secretion protein Q